MIRRVFWLLVGAFGGIVGYRRAVAVGRSVTGMSGRVSGRDRSANSVGGVGVGGEETAALRARRVRRGLVRGTIVFGRGTIRFSRDARSFTRDVREGMDLYIARHPGPEDNTLAPSEDTNVKDGR